MLATIIIINQLDLMMMMMFRPVEREVCTEREAMMDEIKKWTKRWVDFVSWGKIGNILLVCM